MNNQSRPEPLMNSAGLASLFVVLVNAAVGMLTALGYVSWDTGQEQAVNTFAVALINVAAILGPMWFGARPKITPLSDPQDATGSKLTRADGTDAVTQEELR